MGFGIRTSYNEHDYTVYNLKNNTVSKVFLIMCINVYTKQTMKYIFRTKISKNVSFSRELLKN